MKTSGMAVLQEFSEVFSFFLMDCFVSVSHFIWCYAYNHNLINYAMIPAAHIGMEVYKVHYNGKEYRFYLEPLNGTKTFVKVGKTIGLGSWHSIGPDCSSTTS